MTEVNAIVILLFFNILSGNLFSWTFAVEVLDLELIVKPDIFFCIGMSMMLVLKFLEVLFVLLCKVLLFLFFIQKQKLA